MKNKALFLSILFLFLGCKKQEFDDFDFSYSNTFETDFSIKFSSKNDSIFLYENWAAENKQLPRNKTSYLSTLNEKQRSKLESFMSNIDFKSLDTLYFEKYQDGEYYSFYIRKDKIRKTIKVHSYNAPKSLSNFAHWIYETKKSLKLKETQKSFEFKSKKNYPKLPPAINQESSKQ
ncbi:hypothetical protein [Chryseobacterium sp. JV558]|uniref:hypothetical protein n=1 Tax=Chryseobacterium sp. JV558 TaxID=2663236 RepID=UPI00299D3AE6|nr:hypothetical protein [Chryseobacterium sp. JV558]MDW9379947.1 hypothetical protein [Chryseobacterium sp. JV558]